MGKPPMATIYRFVNEGACREKGLEGATNDNEAIALVEDFGMQGLTLAGGRVERVDEGAEMFSSITIICIFDRRGQKEPVSTQGEKKVPTVVTPWEIPDADFGREDDLCQK